MITGYAKAGMALNSQEYIDRAVQAMEFLVKYVFKPDGKGAFDLLRSCYRDDNNEGVTNLKIPIFGCVDDFANLVAASIDLYHATYELKYLEQAIQVGKFFLISFTFLANIFLNNLSFNSFKQNKMNCSGTMIWVAISQVELTILPLLFE